MSEIVVRAPNQSRRHVVMGVCGCGKTEIGRRLAQRLGLNYFEGDSVHPASNLAKMSAGIPLDDSDRESWLQRLQLEIMTARQAGEGLVMACSSLKRRYRDLLRQGDPALLFIHLEGDRDMIAARMKNRQGHFMPPALLDSQFRDLEPLMPDEAGMRLGIHCEPEKIVDQIMDRLDAVTPP